MRDSTAGFLHAVLCTLMVSPAVAALQGEVTARGYEITVMNGSDVTLNDDDVAALVNGGASRDLYKLGTGRLVVATDLEGAGYKGTVYLNAGYLRASADGAVGKSRENTEIVLHVADGASLELDAAVEEAVRPLRAYVSGTGVDGAGAVYGVGSTERKANFNPNDLYLTDDTRMVVGEGSWGLSSFSAVRLEGHTLTLSGGKTFYIVNSHLTGPGEVSVTDGTTLYLENQAQNRLTGAPVIRLADGTKIKFGGNGPQTYTKSEEHGRLIVAGDASLLYGYWDGQDTKLGRYDGAIELQGDLTISCFVNANHSKFRLGGVITGTGGIVYDSVSLEPFQITNATSVIGGSVSVRQGSLEFHGRSSGVAGEKGTLVVDLADETDLTDDDLYGLWRSYTDNAVLETDLTFERDANYQALDKSGEVLQMPVVFPDGEYRYTTAFADEVVVTHAGAGSTLYFDGEMEGPPAFKNYSGTLVFAGRDQSTGWVDVRGGTAIVAEDAAVCRGTNVWCVAADYPDVARLLVRGELTTSTATGIFCGRNFASAPDQARGIVEIFDGARLDDPFTASGNTCNGWSLDALKQGTGCGAYYQHGGEVMLHESTAVYMGSGFAMFYCLEDGFFRLDSATANRQLRMGTRKGCRSTFVQRGGVVSVTNFNFCIGSNAGDATYYHSDGEMRFSDRGSGLTLCRANDAGQNVSGSHGILTMDGPTARIVMETARPSLCRQSDSVAEVNLNNGAEIRAAGLRGCNDVETIANTRTIVTANGGRINLVPVSNTYHAYVFWHFIEESDRVTLYEKGLTIEVDELPDGVEFKVGMPLSAPEGKGVEAIAVPDAISSLPAWEFIAPPTVEITDPDGTGADASAIALFDTVTGKVTGFRVMNRGRNYTRAVATVTGGGTSESFEIECTLTDNVSGGLVKDGVGTLVVNKPCTYTGKTVLRKGQLKLNVDKALMADSRIVLAGGTLNMNGKTLSDGSTSVKNWGADVATAIAEGPAVYDSLSFAEDSEITVSGAAALLEAAMENVKRVVILKSNTDLQNRPTVKIEGDVELGEWTLRWYGNSLTAKRPDGFFMVVR